MNKYLEKIASFGKAVNRIGNFAEDVIGSKANRLSADADALARHSIAKNSPQKVRAMANEAALQTRDARVKLGLGAGAALGAGFLGIHRYHQHKDRAIMERLNAMGKTPTTK